jgi:broad specificity phosphatase PhoE
VLAGALRGMGLVQFLTSSEPKAIQTGQALASVLEVPATSDSRLGEVARPWVADNSEFVEEVHSYLRGDTIAGWEPHTDVIQRMNDATLNAEELGLVGLVSHGTAISLFLERRGLGRAWDFWCGLTAPDGWLIEAQTVRRVWDGPQRD